MGGGLGPGQGDVVLDGVGTSLGAGFLGSASGSRAEGPGVVGRDPPESLGELLAPMIDGDVEPSAPERPRTLDDPSSGISFGLALAELLDRGGGPSDGPGDAGLDRRIGEVASPTVKVPELSLGVGEISAGVGAERGTSWAASGWDRQYCWPIHSIEDLRLAPFQILAGEGKVHALTDHLWHIELLTRLADAAPATFRATATTIVDLDESASEAAGVAWWEELTGRGGEGMVVKPVDVVHRGPKGLTQPGIKCRGPEYLRIIYGPEYTIEANLGRLRSRSLGHKRSLALQEFALGIEGLERFVAGEPLYRVHECAFGVLAPRANPSTRDSEVLENTPLGSNPKPHDATVRENVLRADVGHTLLVDALARPRVDHETTRRPRDSGHSRALAVHAGQRIGAGQRPFLASDGVGDGAPGL